MKEDSKHIIPYELFIKYLNNELNEHEDITLQSWLKANPEHSVIFDEYKSTWNLMDKVKDVANINLEKEWSKQKNFSHIESQNFVTEEKMAKSRFQWSFSKIAAVFVVLILSAATIYYILPQFTQEKIASNTEIRQLVLPDGSEVTLNINSKIKYPTTFDKKERKVFIEGEAYFDVTRDAEAPFKILTGEALIEVLGTSFNVSAYSTNEEVEVVVTEGTVALSSSVNPDNRIILERGAKGIYNPSNKYLVRKTNSDINFMAWKTGKIIFDNDSLSKVMNTIGKIYNKRIILENKDLGACTLTVTFEKQTLESVLNVIESTLNLELEQKDETITVTGDGC
jgi:ferric-dicitrate binding protein FerR (iron transport regulator)